MKTKTETILILELNDGKLGLSQRIRTKVFIVFDWKEDTSVEEEEVKLTATKFVISYVWLWREKEIIFKLAFSLFDYLIICSSSQEARLPGVTS